MTARKFSTASLSYGIKSNKNDSFKYRGESSSYPAYSGSQIISDYPTAPSGLYWMDINDGRGVTQYYVNTTFANGPWVLACNNMNSTTGDAATRGIFNNGSPSITPNSTSVLNTNFASNSLIVPYNGILGATPNGSYVYFLIDSTARSIINTELRDTAGETSSSAAAHSYFAAAKVGASINGGPHVDTYSLGSVIELHHGGWSAGNNINFIIMNLASGKSPGGGYEADKVGFGNSWDLGNGTTVAASPQNPDAIYIKV
jgi:hypothetical protein